MRIRATAVLSRRTSPRSCSPRTSHRSTRPTCPKRKGSRPSRPMPKRSVSASSSTVCTSRTTRPLSPSSSRTSQHAFEGNPHAGKLWVTPEKVRMLLGQAEKVDSSTRVQRRGGVTALHNAHSSPQLRLSRKWWFRSEEHTSELQSQSNLVCRLLLEKKNKS